MFTAELKDSDFSEYDLIIYIDPVSAPSEPVSMMVLKGTDRP
jgi:hypothetical protein